jgi:hypothetical protein
MSSEVVVLAAVAVAVGLAVVPLMVPSSQNFLAPSLKLRARKLKCLPMIS